MLVFRRGIRHICPIEAKLGVLAPIILLYTDDIMIFCMAIKDNILLIRDIFSQYRQSSGQIVSPSKSRVFFGKHVSLAFKHYFSNSLGFVEGSIPFVYWGFPFFFGKPKVRHLNSIADKILLKFDKWSGKILSLAGRICLVNSVAHLH